MKEIKESLGKAEGLLSGKAKIPVDIPRESGLLSRNFLLVLGFDETMKPILSGGGR